LRVRSSVVRLPQPRPVVARPGLGLLPLLGLLFSSAPAPPELYPLSLHDALPISSRSARSRSSFACVPFPLPSMPSIAISIRIPKDRKSTRLNSSHVKISYAVFCLKKKKASAALQNSCLEVAHRPSAHIGLTDRVS